MEPNLTVARHAETRELLGAYALGAIDAEEAAAVRAHLATCAECQAEIAQFWQAADALPGLIEPMDPPPALRDRISAAVQAEIASGTRAAPSVWPGVPAPVQGPPARLREPEPIRPAKWWNRAAPWAAAAAILLLLSAGLLVWNQQLRDQIPVVTPTAAETIALAPTDVAPGASGEVTSLPDDNLLLLDVRDLPALAPGEVYEVWLLAGDDPPTPVGVFDQSTDRHAIVADRGQFDTLAITNEPGPLGTEAPTGEIVATAPL